MSVSKAQQEAVNRYLAKTYDDIKVRVQKGNRDLYKNIVSSLGYDSFNQFCIDAIEEKIKREAVNVPTLSSSSGSVSVSDSVQ